MGGIRFNLASQPCDSYVNASIEWFQITVRRIAQQCFPGNSNARLSEQQSQQIDFTRRHFRLSPIIVLDDAVGSQ